MQLSVLRISIFSLIVAISFPTFAQEILFIVNANNPISEISKSDLRDYYLKKKRKWPDGTSLRFLDRRSDLRVRKLFLKNYINKTDDEIELYWIGQKLYTGDSAPLKETSDSMAVQFVKSFKGAFTYVPAGTALPDGVKPVSIR